MNTSAKEHCINFMQQPYFSNIFDAQNLLEDTLDNTSHCFLQFLSLFIVTLKPGCFIFFFHSLMYKFSHIKIRIEWIKI